MRVEMRCILGILFTLLSLLTVEAQSRVFEFSDKTLSEKDSSGDKTSLDYTYYSLTEEMTSGVSANRFSIALPDGNYRVTVTFDSKRLSGDATIFAESSRLLLMNQPIERGEESQHTFVVNKRSPRISDSESARLKEKIAVKRNWDDSLSLDIYCAVPLKSIVVEPVNVRTIFLCGDSTVCDYDDEPYASWGQILPLFLGDNIAVANYAESGETASSCMSSKRFAKALSQLKSGDYLFIELGHNDQKQQGAGKGAYYSFTHELKTMIDNVRMRGGKPVLLTPLQRRRWSGGQLQDSHSDYPEAVRVLAEREGVPLIDLTQLTTTLLTAFGEQQSKQLYVHLPANTLPNQTKELRDNSHFSPFGAYQVAKIVVESLHMVMPELNEYFRAGWSGFSPAQPDDPNDFEWDIRVGSVYSKPAGN